MKKLFVVMTALVSTSVLAASDTPGNLRIVRLAPSNPAAVGSGDHVLPQNTHLSYYMFKARGAKSIGLSILDGPFYPVSSGGPAEIFYVYDGSAIITQANGHDVPIKKGEIGFVPRGVLYGGKNFVHYKHAYIVFDPGKGSVPGAPSGFTVLRPQLLGEGDFKIEGSQRVHYYYHGADGSSVRAWEPASSASADASESQLQSAEFTVVLKGSITLTSAGHTLTERAGDVFFAPKGAKLSYTSHDLRALTVVSVADARGG